MDTSTSIRKALPEDAEELARLRWEYRTQDQSAQSRQEFCRDFETWLREALSADRWVVAVASTGDGALSGCMYLQRVDKVPIPGDIERAWGYITNAYVSGEHRGGGLGRALLDLLIEVARADRQEFLIVWPSEDAVSFYQRGGFRPASEIHDRPDDYPPLELEL